MAEAQRIKKGKEGEGGGGNETSWAEGTRSSLLPPSAPVHFKAAPLLQLPEGGDQEADIIPLAGVNFSTAATSSQVHLCPKFRKFFKCSRCSAESSKTAPNSASIPAVLLPNFVPVRLFFAPNNWQIQAKKSNFFPTTQMERKRLKAPSNSSNWAALWPSKFPPSWSRWPRSCSKNPRPPFPLPPSPRWWMAAFFPLPLHQRGAFSTRCSFITAKCRKRLGRMGPCRWTVAVLSPPPPMAPQRSFASDLSSIDAFNTRRGPEFGWKGEST